MSTDSVLLSPQGPWLHPFLAAPGDAWDFVMLRLAVHGKARLACRTLRGQKSRTEQSLFDECAVALQFPYYFGENWDAFDECINDLEWLHAEAYVLLILNSVHLLESEPVERRSLFLQRLESAGREWSTARAGDFARGARPFHVLLQGTPTEEPALKAMMHLAKVASSLLHLGGG